MNIREGQTNQNEWQRIIFPISKCSGKILLSHFKDSSLYNKASIEDIKLSFTLIEKKTHHFRRIRFCFIIKVVLIIITKSKGKQIKKRPRDGSNIRPTG